MDDFGDIAEDPGAFGRFNTEGGISGADLEAKMQEQFSTKFINNDLFSKLSVKYDKVSGETVITNTETGETMTTKELAKKVNGDFSVDPPVAPDLEGYFKFLAGDSFRTDDATFTRVDEAKSKSFSESKQKVIQDRMADAKKNADAIADKNAIRKGNEDVWNKWKEDAEAKMKSEGKTSWSDTIASWLKYGVYAFGVYLTYEAIEDHMNKVNGCWLVNPTTGAKCKILNLSCNASAVDPGANGQVCPTCKDVLGGTNGGASGNTPTNFGSSSSNSCPALSWSPGFAANLQGSPPVLTLPIATNYQNNYPGGTDDAGKCTYENQTVCGGTNSCNGVASDPCNDTSCNSSTYNLPPNCILRCVNMTLLEALDDMFNGCLPSAPSGGGILDTIIKYLLYALGIILGVYVVYLVGKWVLGKITSSHSENNEITLIKK
jgi:hypothetical protein